MPAERGDELPEGYGPTDPVPYQGYAPSPQHPGMPPYAGQGQAAPFYPAPPYPPAPPAPFVANAPPVRKRRRVGCWITAGALVVLVLASVAAFFVIGYFNRSTPDKTLDAFCNALQQADYQSAYGQFSATLQHTISEAAFAATFAQDKVVACTHGSTGDSGSSVTNNLALVHASKGINRDIVTLIKDSNNTWKINDIYRQTSRSPMDRPPGGVLYYASTRCAGFLPCVNMLSQAAIK
jgi:hypothetical protein